MRHIGFTKARSLRAPYEFWDHIRALKKAELCGVSLRAHSIKTVIVSSI